MGASYAAETNLITDNGNSNQNNNQNNLIKSNIQSSAQIDTAGQSSIISTIAKTTNTTINTSESTKINTSKSSNNDNNNNNNGNGNGNGNSNGKSIKTSSKGQAAAGEPTKLTQSQILSASKTVNAYIAKYKKLPNSVTIAGYKFSMPEYMYLLSKTIYYKYNKKTTQITIKYDIKNPTTPSGVTIKGKLSKKQYYTYTKNLIKYIDNNKKLPNYLTTKLGKMQYQAALSSLNKIVYYAATHKGALPTSTTISITKTHSINKYLPKYTRTVVVSHSLADIEDAASRIVAYVNKNGKLPKTVLVSKKTYTMSSFLYLLSSGIVNINNKISNSITPIAVETPTKPMGDSIDENIPKGTYVSLAKNVTNYIKKEKQAPNYANSPYGRIQYQTLIFEFSKILSYVEENGELPDNLTVDVKSSDPLNGGDSGDSQSATLNDKYNGESLTKYLAATKNCQVTNAAIKTLAAKITKGCTTDKSKATAIFNWMKKNVAYSFYYDTKYGALKVSTVKRGNCVDQAHLSVALYRAAGLAARYVHGSATFSSGSRYGHVWAQVLIGDTWTVSDTTSSRNSLGVVNNWNPKTMTLKSGKVVEITF